RSRALERSPARSVQPLNRAGAGLGFRPYPLDLFGEDLDGLADLLLGMRRRAEEAQPRRGLLDRRIEDWLHVDPALLEPVADLQRVQRVAEDGGHHRAAFREAGVDPFFPGELEEQPRAVVQPRHLLGMRLQLPQ